MDGAAPAANHASENPVGQTYNRFDVQPYLSDLLGERRLEKVAGGGNTIVVDQELDLTQLSNAPDYRFKPHL